MNTLLLCSFISYFVSYVLATGTKCTDGTFKADPNSCDHFLKCDHGSYVKFACGPGTWFNPKINVCDWPYNVECAVSGKGHNNGGKPDSGNVHTPGTYDGDQHKPGTNPQDNGPGHETPAPLGPGEEEYMWPVQDPSNYGSTGQDGRPRPTIDDLYAGNNPYQEYQDNGRWK